MCPCNYKDPGSIFKVERNAKCSVIVKWCNDERLQLNWLQGEEDMALI